MLLKHHLRFDSFVVGQANRFAHTAARQVADSPGTVYNPLIMYGPSGVGKTHLLQAIGHAATERLRLDVRCLSAATLMEELVHHSTRSSQAEQFGSNYERCGLLLVDDVQLLAGRDALQEELAWFLAQLVADGKQVVLASGGRAGATRALEGWMYRRFTSGLMAALQPPDLELRRAIAHRLADSSRLRFPDEVLELLAIRIGSNVRELEGVMLRLEVLVDLEGEVLTPEFTGKVLSDLHIVEVGG